MIGFLGQLCKTLQKRASGDDKKCMEKEWPIIFKQIVNKVDKGE